MNRNKIIIILNIFVSITIAIAIAIIQHPYVDGISTELRIYLFWKLSKILA